MPKHIKLDREQCRVQVEFRPGTVDEEKRTVEVVFTTGQAGRRYDYRSDTEFMEELEISRKAIDTSRLDKGLSVIDSHRRYDGINGVFAITEGYRIGKGELTGDVRFATDENSDVIFQKVKDGILRHVSLGYSVSEYKKVSHREGELPVYRAIKWQPHELSFVPVSFETTNGVRRSDDSATIFAIQIKEENIMTPEQIRAAIAAAQARNAPETEIADLQRQLGEAVMAIPTPTPAARSQEPIPTPTPAASRSQEPAEPVIDEDTVRTEERGQLQPMIDACRSAGLVDDFAIRNFNEGITVDKFRAMVIEELSNKSSENMIRTAGTVLNEDGREDRIEQIRKDAESALLYRCGSSDVELTDGVRAYTGLTLHEMGRQFLESSGMKTVGMSRQRIAERAFHSTSDFPLILENVMNKNLQAAYRETPQTFRDLGRRTTVNDFRDKHTYSVGDAPNLLPLGEHGEYKAGTFSEGKEKYAIATYARKIGFTRQMLINDDMSALDRVPAMFGQAGSRLESDIVWGLILNYNFFKNAADNITMEDGLPLFDAAHGNLLGAGSAFSVTALSNLRKLGRKMKTIDGNFMNVTYDSLVVPEDIETEVEKVLVQNILPVVTGETNPFQGKLQHRVEPRLSQVSQTAYLAFSKTVDTFEYAYLAGEEEMYTETDNSTDIDGITIKVRKDFGAGMVDYRGVAKATGAA